MKEVLDRNPNELLELFKYEEFEFATISPLSITVEGFGYSINDMVSFQQSLGLKIYDRLNLDDEKRKIIKGKIDEI